MNFQPEKSNNTPEATLAGINPEKLYTTREIADLTNFSPEFYEAMRYRGEGPPWLTVNRRAVRYIGSAVIDWLKSGTRMGGAGNA